MKEIFTNIILVLSLIILTILGIAAFIGMMFGIMMAILYPFKIVFGL